MSQQAFEAALKFTLYFEGGYVDNPADAGKATNQGITQFAYDIYRRHLKLAPQPVKLATEWELKQVYLLYFWSPSHASEFSFPLALAMFDTWVQFNPTTAAKFFGYAANNPNPTDYAATLKLLHDVPLADHVKIALRICELRINFRFSRVEQNPSQTQFLKGWLRRDNALKAQVQSQTSLSGIYQDEVGEPND